MDKEKFFEMTQEASEDLSDEVNYCFKYHDNEIVLREETGKRRYEDEFVGKVHPDKDLVQMDRKDYSRHQPLVFQFDRMGIDIVLED